MFNTDLIFLPPVANFNLKGVNANCVTKVKALLLTVINHLFPEGLE
jgi:uncharacterized membrane protein YqaE (UPF0057 family)